MQEINKHGKNCAGENKIGRKLEAKKLCNYFKPFTPNGKQGKKNSANNPDDGIFFPQFSTHDQACNESDENDAGNNGDDLDAAHGERFISKYDYKLPDYKLRMLDQDY